jgi:hypothetical protein
MRHASCQRGHQRKMKIKKVPRRKPRGREDPFCMLFSLHWLWNKVNKPQEPLANPFDLPTLMEDKLAFSISLN